jgi:hypothetical protein
MTFKKALAKLPSVTGFDALVHKTIEDLCWICLFELDLHAEHEYWHPLAVRKQLLNFCKKHGYYASEAQEQFNIGRNHCKEDAYM